MTTITGTANLTDTTSTAIIAAGGTNIQNVVTSILVTNKSASVGTKVQILNGATVVIQGNAEPGGGFSYGRGDMPLFVGSKNTAVNAKCVTTGADVDVNITCTRKTSM